MVKGGLSVTIRVKSPSKSVLVPTDLLETLILAPGSVSPVKTSVTTPVTVVCANMAVLPKTTNAISKIFFIII